MQKFIKITIDALKSIKISPVMSAAISGAGSQQKVELKKRAGEECEQEDSTAKKLKTDICSETDGTKQGEIVPYKKKKVALYLIYSGKEYYGMQSNPGFRTVESELLAALVKAGVITQSHADAPGEKMFIDVDNPIEKINSHLPYDIRLLDIKRTTQGFCCKNAATARTYLYMIPTFAFTPITEFTQETFRITDDVLQKVNDVLKLFKGTHNFHNFTSGKKPTDRSATRYIMDFYMEKPFERQGLEFACIMVKGQSFMMHQIRKMIGLTIAIVQGLTDTEVMEKCWGPEKVDVPKAPGLGLMLEKLHYDLYNKKFGNDGMHEALNWDNLKDEVDKFKEEFIFKTMIETEKEQKSMMTWLQTLQCHNYEKTDVRPGVAKALQNITEQRKEALNIEESKTDNKYDEKNNSIDTKTSDDRNDASDLEKCNS